jgi:hypothetical protein
MIDLEKRNRIAQIMVDLPVGSMKPITKTEMIPLIEEVNRTTLIGGCCEVRRTDAGIMLVKVRQSTIEARIYGNA